MGHHIADIVRVVRVVLNDYSHHPTNELYVWSQAAKRAEYGRDAEAWVIKALTEHLDLDNAVELVQTKPIEDRIALVLRHVAMDLCGPVAIFLIDGADLASVIN